MKRAVLLSRVIAAILAAAALAGGPGGPAFAYTWLNNQMGGGLCPGWDLIYLKWPLIQGLGLVNGGIWINPNCPDPSSEGDSEEDALIRAMDTWNAADANFTLVYSGITSATPYDGSYNPDLSDNLSVVGWNPNIDGEGGLIAQTWTFFECWGEILEADVEFDDVHPWSSLEIKPLGSFDIESVALHEFGHVIGHGENYANTSAAMFPNFSVDSVRRELDENDDTVGVQWAYGTRIAGVEDFRVYE